MVTWIKSWRGYAILAVMSSTVALVACAPQAVKGTTDTPSTAGTTTTTTATADFMVVDGNLPAGQVGATYVGEAVCEGCHATEATAYKSTVHYRIGNDATYNGAWAGKSNQGCRSCHTVGEDVSYHASPSVKPLLVNGAAAGFDYAKNATDVGTGSWLADSLTSKFNGIQCENCHGPGSNHVAISMSDPDLRAKKKNTITGKPAYSKTCTNCHTTTSGNVHYVNGQFIPWAGALDVDVNAGGAGATPHHPQSLAYLQSGGYTFGSTFPTNAHNTKLGNGCIDCHISGTAAQKHDINLGNNNQRVIAAVCSKCHGTTMTPDSITVFQSQTKLALDGMNEVMIAYRKLFCKQVLVGSATSSAAADIANLNNKASLWDDTPAGVTKVTGTASTWSTHQTHFNAAYWNWDLVEVDKSFGIHAPSYEQGLLRISNNTLVADMGAANASSTSSFEIMSVKH